MKLISEHKLSDVAVSKTVYYTNRSSQKLMEQWRLQQLQSGIKNTFCTVTFMQKASPFSKESP